MQILSNNLKLVLSPSEFVRQYLGFNPDAWQCDMLDSSHKRIILNCARQVGKSTISAALALHTALYTNGSLILLISPSERQSQELFVKITTFIDLLPVKPEFLELNKLSCQFKNRSRIIALPGNEKTVRGFSGPTLIIEDEAARIPDDLHYSILPMLAVGGGRLLMMSSPFGSRGFFYETWKGDSDILRVMLPASECPRISAKFLQEQREIMDNWYFAQEFECQFMDDIQSIFSTELIMSLFNPAIEALEI